MSAVPMMQSLRDGSPLLLDNQNTSQNWHSNSEVTALMDDEKWPVSQKQPMIIVTRTYQEEKTSERRRTIIASICLLLLIAWLIWALVVTI